MAKRPATAAGGEKLFVPGGSSSSSSSASSSAVETTVLKCGRLGASGNVNIGGAKQRSGGVRAAREGPFNSMAQFRVVRHLYQSTASLVYLAEVVALPAGGAEG